MILTIDIGNTLIDFGLWEEDKLSYLYKTRTKPLRSEDEYRSVFELFVITKHLENANVERAIISSVVPSLSRIFKSVVFELFHIKAKTLGPRLKSGLQIKTDNPAEVGADLVADSVGAVTLFGSNLFIADLGTANKFIYIDETSSFGGCAIAPGISIGARSLSSDTAALPEVTLQTPKFVIGKNTHDSMNSGIINSNVYAIKGFLDSFQKESKKTLKPILTGGNAIFVKDHLPEFIYEENLLMIGLKEIDRRNLK